MQTRGAAVIKARKLSSAMSAAKAACDHMRDWWIGTQNVSVSQYKIFFPWKNLTKFSHTLGFAFYDGTDG